MAHKKLNCWEYIQCGREPQGTKTGESGICPAAEDSSFDGINSGKQAGRICWAVAGTLCKGKRQGSFAEKRSTEILHPLVMGRSMVTSWQGQNGPVYFRTGRSPRSMVTSWQGQSENKKDVKKQAAKKIRFGDLPVYQEAMEGATRIYELTTSFPAEEKESMVNNIRQSSRLVCLKLAEAWQKRNDRKVFIEKLGDAESQVCQTQVWLDFSLRCDYIQETKYMELNAIFEQVIDQLITLKEHTATESHKQA